LKILLLNHTDTGGGAAIAAKRLLETLCQYGINAVLGVVEKKSIDKNVVLVKKSFFFDKIKFFRILEKIILKLSFYLKRAIYKSTNPIFHSCNKRTFINIKLISNSDYDLIHLHWINKDMISIEDIAKIKKPIIWTMHDSWVFCGAEHHPNVLESDNRFIQGYTRKNKPKTTRGPDICRKTWERKKRAWKNCEFNFISPSNYEKESIKKSALFNTISYNCTVIPNITPEDTFKPFNKEMLKELYQIPPNKKVIGFGAADNVTDKKALKGGYLLLDALRKIEDKINYQLVIFGDISISFSTEIEIPIFATGFITNPNILAGIYNLCDVFVCPSLVENLPNVCTESLFCGIPVAAFDTGGIPDIVEHKKTGYLAKCFDTEDLFNGIIYCIDNYNELSKNSLIKARSEFGNDEIVKKHIELYEYVLQRGTP